MLARRHKAIWPERFLLQLPWLGPVQGEPVGDTLQIGACADPLLGGPLMATLFLPVRRDPDRDRFTRAPGSGWAMMPPRDPVDGRFRILPPLKWWDEQCDGVLMVLFYDRSHTLPKRVRKRKLPISLQQRLEIELGKTDTTRPWSIADLPGSMSEQLEYQLERFLDRPIKDLELGLIERDRRPASDNLTFAVASCQYPANFIDRDVAQRSYQRLQSRMTGDLPPRRLLLVGDQVYIDATAGLFDPSTLSDRYDLPYERLLRTEPLRHVLRRVPLHAMLDDHEIEDNWEPPSGDVENLRKGRDYYLAFQRMASPPDVPERLWYDFEANGFRFFMADTRTERKSRDAGNFPDSRIMDDVQFGKLTKWLTDQDKDKPKFIASPSAFLPRRRRALGGSGAGALRSDSWDGYPKSFNDLVKHIAGNGIQNVVFLSGDEHISFATTAVVRDRAGKVVTRIFSIHSSALYAPLPFANSTLEDLADSETFDSGDYRLTVSTDFAPPGDGFALLRAWRDRDGWHVRYLFDREPPEPEVWIDLV